MKANPDKFQAICIGKKTYDNIETYRIGETVFKCENNVSLLGINIDFMLKFDDHVTEICKNASDRGLMLWLFVGPTRVYLLDFFCSGIQFYLLLSSYLALSPCYILIYMF